MGSFPVTKVIAYHLQTSVAQPRPCVTLARFGDLQDLQALTLVGPTMENLVPHPLSVQHLINRLYMNTLNRKVS